MRLLHALGLLLPALAHAAPGGRSVAVLEYRAGVSQLPGLAERLAAELARASSLDVVGPPEARRRYGTRLDAQLARCSGDARCVAEIGARLGVKEVLLIGISQVGDVVLAMQRILVDRAEVAAREAESLPPDVSPEPDALLRYLVALLPPEDFVRHGEIRIRSDVVGATVFLDGQARGQTPLPGLRVLAPRRYQIRIAKGGHQDFRANLEVPPDAVVEVQPALPPLPPPEAWYRRWWVWAIAGGVLTGTAVAIAAGSGGGPDRVDVVIRR